jgi:hypothetical protein
MSSVYRQYKLYGYYGDPEAERVVALADFGRSTVRGLRGAEVASSTGGGAQGRRSASRVLLSLLFYPRVGQERRRQ